MISSYSPILVFSQSVKNEDDLKIEDDLKNEDNLKSEEDLKKLTILVFRHAAIFFVKFAFLLVQDFLKITLNLIPFNSRKCSISFGSSELAICNFFQAFWWDW